MKGPSAEVRCGYQVAARLGSWEMSPKIGAGPNVENFKAAVSDVDEFWIAQEPLALVVKVGRTVWTYEPVTVVVDGRVLHADLRGKPAIRPA